MNLGKLNYDGSLIHDRFGYKYFKDQYVATGCIVSFRGNMSVTTNLIDLEDKLNNDFIFSDDAINFCWEIPNLCAVGGVAFQRLFCTYVAHVLSNLIKAEITMKGDDIMVKVEDNQYKKASVSISTTKNGCVLGHLGINIDAGSKAPAFAYSTNLNDEQIEAFMQEVTKVFYDTTRSIFVATTKTI
jgi:hypothetical protein